MSKLAYVGDVVTIDISKCVDKSHWEPLSKIRGVVVQLDGNGREPRWARVIWTEECGLSLHWGRDSLIVVIPKKYWPRNPPAGINPESTILE